MREILRSPESTFPYRCTMTMGKHGINYFSNEDFFTGLDLTPNIAEVSLGGKLTVH